MRIGLYFMLASLHYVAAQITGVDYAFDGDELLFELCG